MTSPVRAAILIGAPVAFSGLLWLHPMVGDWEGLRDATTRFQAVHVAMVLTFCLVAVGMPPPSTCPTSRSRASRSARSARSSTASRPPSGTRWHAA